MGNDVWDAVWKIGRHIGLSWSWKIGGPTDEERIQQEERAGELRRQNNSGYSVRDMRVTDDGRRRD